MSLTPEKKKDLLSPEFAGLVKTHLVYDAQGNVTDRYIAFPAVGNGEACLRQRYTYIVVASLNLVENTSNEDATWNSAWDIT